MRVKRGGYGAMSDWNGGETGHPRENPMTSGIVRHDSHVRKFDSDPAGNRTREKELDASVRIRVIIVSAFPEGRTFVEGGEKRREGGEKSATGGIGRGERSKVSDGLKRKKTSGSERSTAGEEQGIGDGSLEWRGERREGRKQETYYLLCRQSVGEVGGGRVLQEQSEMSVEQRWNERAGETGAPRENLPTSGIVRHDSHMRKSGSDSARNGTRFAKVASRLNTTMLQGNGCNFLECPQVFGHRDKSRLRLGEGVVRKGWICLSVVRARQEQQALISGAGNLVGPRAGLRRATTVKNGCQVVVRGVEHPGVVQGPGGAAATPARDVASQGQGSAVTTIRHLPFPFTRRSNPTTLLARRRELGFAMDRDAFLQPFLVPSVQNLASKYDISRASVVDRRADNCAVVVGVSGKQIDVNVRGVSDIRSALQTSVANDRRKLNLITQRQSSSRVQKPRAANMTCIQTATCVAWSPRSPDVMPVALFLWDHVSSLGPRHTRGKLRHRQRENTAGVQTRHEQLCRSRTSLLINTTVAPFTVKLRVDVMSMEQRRNERGRGNGRYPSKKHPPTSTIVRYDSHMRKPGSHVVATSDRTFSNPAQVKAIANNGPVAFSACFSLDKSSECFEIAGRKRIEEQISKRQKNRSRYPTVSHHCCARHVTVQPATRPCNLPPARTVCHPAVLPATRPYNLPPGRTACNPAVQPATWPYCLPPGRTTCHPAVLPATWPYCLPPGRTTCHPAVLPATRPYNLPPGRTACHPAVLATSDTAASGERRMEEVPGTENALGKQKGLTCGCYSVRDSSIFFL
ncbi:hypothetical protein PR048_016738 [Dryococelus australis]|uniref:Uncharacterized protein n=1 Tax=Dryococelus australis TaxID=614101 RepID=A0ABQ9H7N6_9NEOP|nr:hypothetical protein PR048_016738 [Dryococelus australis]